VTEKSTILQSLPSVKNRYSHLLGLAHLSLAPIIALLLRFEGTQWFDGYI
jgi:hypothetical protein